MIDLLLATPAIVKVLVSLGLILVINGLFKNLLVSLIAGSTALAAWCGYGLDQGLGIAWERFSSRDNLLLVLVILHVIWLSNQMSRAGVMQDLVEAVRQRVSRRTAMAALPAVIGLLPMPGGAVFSAPLVDKCDATGSISALLKVRTNYWFRHVWEYWWPLYPGVLLALDITGLEVGVFVLIQIPFSLVALLAGYLFLLRRIAPAGEEQAATTSAASPPALLPLVAPILVVVIAYTVFKLCFPGLARISSYLPLLIGIVAAMTYVQFYRPLRVAQWREIWCSRKSLTMVILVAAVQIYGAFIEGRLPDEGVLLVTRMREELAQWGIPAQLMVMILPFVAGLTTGLTIGFVGASFPIVISLMGEGTPMNAYLGMVSLAYICGFAGMILSPVHICLIVTNQHFKTRLSASLVGLVLPAALVVLAAVVGYGLWTA